MEKIGEHSLESQLDEQREKINAIDRELVELINLRSAVSLEIGKIKRMYGLPVYVPAREEIVLQQIEAINEEGIVPQEEMRRIFQAIMKSSRAVQEDVIQIATLSDLSS